MGSRLEQNDHQHPTRNLDTARDFGASLAGVALVGDLKETSSYPHNTAPPYEDHSMGVEWPDDARIVLLQAVVHDPSESDLDWWSAEVPGRPP